MNDEALISASDANFFERFRRLTRLGELIEADGLMLVAPGIPVAAFNAALVTGPLGDPAASLANAIDYFAQRDVPFGLRLRDGMDPETERVALEMGFAFQHRDPGMVLTEIPDAPGRPAELSIRPMTTDDDRADAAEALSDGFGAPLRMGQWLASTTQDHDESQFYVGYVDGEPVGTAQLVRSGDVAGIYGVSTKESHRRHGFAEALTWAAIHEGVARGCTLASLQSSEMAESIYRRMGFRKVTSYATYELSQ